MPYRASFRDRDSWQGRHKSYRQPIEGYYYFSEATAAPGLDEYNLVTQDLQSIIADAVQNSRSLRAMGSSWSLSTVGVARDRLINTKNLVLIFPISAETTAPAYPGNPNDLRFVETGVEIAQINDYLFDRDLSLKASGSNNGQTLVGAVSTGTHGAAFRFGATPDFVVGIHLITGPSTQIYLQRASYPVVGESFASLLGAQLVSDDELFNAALVSFGSFGIIHGIMIETRKRFLLHAHRFFHRFDQGLKSAISSLDFSNILFPQPWSASDLYHFQVFFNPNEGTPPDEAAVLMMFEAPWIADYEPPVWDADAPGPGASGLEIVAAALGALPPVLSRPMLAGQIRNHLHTYAVTGTFKDLFRGEKVEGKLFVSDIGLPLSRSLEALAIAFDVYEHFPTPLPMTLMMRFVKGTQALLGHTKFDPTCTLEIDAINTADARRYAETVWTELENANIPFTMHWGKLNWFLKPDRVRRMYGDNVRRWIESRESLLTADVRKVFTNDFLTTVGLAT